MHRACHERIHCDVSKHRLNVLSPWTCTHFFARGDMFMIFARDFSFGNQRQQAGSIYICAASVRSCTRTTIFASVLPAEQTHTLNISSPEYLFLILDPSLIPSQFALARDKQQSFRPERPLYVRQRSICEICVCVWS